MESFGFVVYKMNDFHYNEMACDWITGTIFGTENPAHGWDRIGICIDM